MEGTLYRLCIGKGGVGNHTVKKAEVTKERIIGDDWYNSSVAKRGHKYHGGTEQAICLFSFDQLQKINQLGFNVPEGGFSENFLTKGLDYKKIKIGDRFKVGNEVEIQISKPRTPCRQLDEKYSDGLRLLIREKGDYSSLKWGVSGFYARVLKEGIVLEGDKIISF